MPKNPGDTPKRPGRPKSEVRKTRTPIVVTIRGGEDWEKWMDTLCEELRKNAKVKVRVDRTDAIDIALDHLATALNLPEAPPRY